MSSTYIINRAINKPIEFRGLKGQYILYAAAVLVVDFFLFALLYLFHANTWICVGVSFGLGGGAISVLYRRSSIYGEHGMAKKRAARHVPSSILCNSRTVFIQLNKGHAKIS